MPDAAFGHDAHGVIDRQIFGRGDDLDGHVTRNRVLQSFGAARRHGANDVALRENADDRVAVVAHHDGADPVASEHVCSFAQCQVRLAPSPRCDPCSRVCVQSSCAASLCVSSWHNAASSRLESKHAPLRPQWRKTLIARCLQAECAQGDRTARSRAGLQGSRRYALPMQSGLRRRSGRRRRTGNFRANQSARNVIARGSARISRKPCAGCR